jgi:sRNA-binding carbon storage regulator CsrA
MFIIKAKLNQEVVVPGQDLTLKVLSVINGEIRLGFTSPSGVRVYLKDHLREGRIHPTKGGCWYCHTATPPMMFSTEFDTFVHEWCLKRAAINRCPEGVIMAAELLEPEDAADCSKAIAESPDPDLQI